MIGLAEKFLRIAFETSPLDSSAILAWLVNNEPASTRTSLVKSIEEIIDVHRLTEGEYKGFAPPRIFTSEYAYSLHEDLRYRVKIANSSEKLREKSLLYLENLFKPNTSFSPIAYSFYQDVHPHQCGLAPETVRAYLGMQENDISMLVVSLKNFIEYSGKPITVGVVPYADTLTLPCLIYAVSDLLGGDVEFKLSSFYKGSKFESQYCISGNYDFCFATQYQYDQRVRDQTNHLGCEVCFVKPATRPVLLRKYGENLKGRLKYEMLSLLGDFGGDKKCDFDWVDDGFPKKVTFDESQVPSLTNDVDPIGDWEIDLFLSIISKDQMVNLESRSTQGQVVFVSTDVYSWASYNGLVSSRKPIPGKAYEVASGIKVLGDNLTSGIGFWTPSEDQRSEREDVDSNLVYIMPKYFLGGKDGVMLLNLLDEYLLRPIRLGAQRLDLDTMGPSVSDSINGMRKLGSCLLAPLLEVHPLYQGTLVQTPPELWLPKICSADEHVKRIPLWRQILKNKPKETSVETPLVHFPDRHFEVMKGDRDYS